MFHYLTHFLKFSIFLWLNYLFQLYNHFLSFFLVSFCFFSFSNWIHNWCHHSFSNADYNHFFCYFWQFIFIQIWIYFFFIFFFYFIFFFFSSFVFTSLISFSFIITGILILLFILIITLFFSILLLDSIFYFLVFLFIIIRFFIWKNIIFSSIYLIKFIIDKSILKKEFTYIFKSEIILSIIKFLEILKLFIHLFFFLEEKYIFISIWERWNRRTLLSVERDTDLKKIKFK